MPSPIRHLAALAFAFSAFSPCQGFAQAIDTTLWVTNGAVNAVVCDGSTIYIGGAFTRVGPATGAGVPVDTTSGLPVSGFPKVAGAVYSVAGDGSGGWYVGGSFTAVGGIPRQNIAHILSDNSVSGWNPSANAVGIVYALAVSGSTVYAGGSFSSIGGQTRRQIAALDASSGLATAWNPNVNVGGNVYALAVSGSTVYAGGDFATIGGQARARIAALDATSGLATAWNPNANNVVDALAVSGPTVYAGGIFSVIGGQTRNNIAALDSASGLATAWDPNANNEVLAIAVSGTTVYACGAFTNIGGQNRARIATLDATSGLATTWNPNANGAVWALAVNGTRVYAGGLFTSIGGQARNNLAALDVASGLATAWNPNANNTVQALAVSGSKVYAGGLFTSFGGLVRNNIAALDATTGLPTTWNPNANQSVLALAVRGTIVYAGGSFGSIGGQLRSGIVALDTASGLATAWNPSADFNINALLVSGTTVYAGGDFTTIGGQPRNRIAALDATSGLATAWNPNADNLVYALAMSGTTLYAGGQFTSIGGQTRNHIAGLDTSSGLATAWNPNANVAVNALTASGSTLYAGGNFTTIGGQTRNHIAALGTTSGLATAWNPNANILVRALAVSGSTVYAGGDFTSIGGQTRGRIAALEASSGLATAWDPNAYIGVRALAVSGSMVYAGGPFISLGVMPQAYLGAVAAAPAVSAILPASGGNAGAVTVTVSGGGLPAGAAIKLSRSGQPDIVGTNVVVAADGSSLTATFDLTGAASGARDVVVTTPDSQSATLANGFSVDPIAAPHLRVDIVGPSLMRANHPTPFDLVIQNSGNVDALDVPLWVAGIPTDATMALDFTLAYPTRDAGEPDWTTVPLTFTSAGGRYMTLQIPRVAPGTISRRVILTVPASDPSFQLTAALTSPWGGALSFGACLAAGGVIGDALCVATKLAAIDNILAITPGVEASSGIGAWAKVAWQCEGAATLPAALAKAEQVLDFMGQPVEQSGSLPASCGDVLLPRWREVLPVGVVTSIDPNEKLGARGLQAGQALSDQLAIPYEIRFENLSGASAPAQRVAVVDALDLATLNASTVNLEAIAFGDTVIYPPPGLSSYAQNVDLRPSRNLIVNLNVSLDPFTGVLSWYFNSLDPTTLQPPSNPLVGFLPPNHAPPEGEGSVLFTVMPRAGLTNGTQVRNHATLVFDNNAPNITPEWLNTLDNLAPASHVLPLGAVADTARFTVHWTADGAPGDLKDFTIYVAEGAGDYRRWRENTAATADTFYGTPGRSYRFASQARDSSGNRESLPSVSDAQTTVASPALGVGEAPSLRLALEGALPSPAVGAIQAWFTLPSREAATLELIDIAGRRVMRREVGSLGPGRHMMALGISPRLRPGLYFLRLAQGGLALNARVVLVR